jgi:hypothetical protein
MGQMMTCTTCMSNYDLCDFLYIIDNKQLEKSDVEDNDVYIMHVKRSAIRTGSGLGR